MSLEVYASLNFEDQSVATTFTEVRKNTETKALDSSMICPLVLSVDINHALYPNKFVVKSECTPSTAQVRDSGNSDGMPIFIKMIPPTGFYSWYTQNAHRLRTFRWSIFLAMEHTSHRLCVNVDSLAFRLSSNLRLAHSSPSITRS